MVVAKDMEKLFDFLVDMFCLAIGLRVKGSRQGLVNIKLVPSFSQFGGELGAMV